MTTTIVATMGFSLPAAFPAKSFDAVSQLVGKRPRDRAVTLFANAWNGVAWRLDAVRAHALVLDASLDTEGSSPPPIVRSQQEAALFGLYTNGLSAIECTCFAAYAIGAMARPAVFPIATDAELVLVSPAKVVEAFKGEFPGDGFVKSLRPLVRGQLPKEIRRVRNLLSHRGGIPRGHSLSLRAGSTPIRGPTVWGDVEIEPKMGEARQSVLLAHLARAVAGIEIFALGNI